MCYHNNLHSALADLQLLSALEQKAVVLAMAEATDGPKKVLTFEVEYINSPTPQQGSVGVGSTVLIKSLLLRNGSFALAKVVSIGQPVVVGAYLEAVDSLGVCRLARIASREKEDSLDFVVEYIGPNAPPPEKVQFSSENLHPVGYFMLRPSKDLKYPPGGPVNWKKFCAANPSAVVLHPNLLTGASNTRSHVILPLPDDRIYVQTLDKHPQCLCVSHASLRLLGDPLQTLVNTPPFPSERAFKQLHRMWCRAWEIGTRPTSAKLTETRTRAEKIRELIFTFNPCANDDASILTLPSQSLALRVGGFLQSELGMATIEMRPIQPTDDKAAAVGAGAGAGAGADVADADVAGAEMVAASDDAGVKSAASDDAGVKSAASDEKSAASDDAGVKAAASDDADVKAAASASVGDAVSSDKLIGVPVDTNVMLIASHIETLLRSDISIEQLSMAIGDTPSTTPNMIANIRHLTRMFTTACSAATFEAVLYWFQETLRNGSTAGVPEPCEGHSRRDLELRGALRECISVVSAILCAPRLPPNVVRLAISTLHIQLDALDLITLLKHFHALSHTVGWITHARVESELLGLTDVTHGATAEASVGQDLSENVLNDKETLWEAEARTAPWIQIASASEFDRIVVKFKSVPTKFSANVLAGSSPVDLAVATEVPKFIGDSQLWVTLSRPARCVRINFGGAGTVSVQSIHLLHQQQTANAGSVIDIGDAVAVNSIAVPVIDTGDAGDDASKITARTPSLTADSASSSATAAVVAPASLAESVANFIALVCKRVDVVCTPSAEAAYTPAVVSAAGAELALCLEFTATSPSLTLSAFVTCTAAILRAMIAAKATWPCFLEAIDVSKVVKHILLILSNVHTSSEIVQVEALALLRALMPVAPLETHSEVLNLLLNATAVSTSLLLSSKDESGISLAFSDAIPPLTAKAMHMDFARFQGKALEKLVELINDLLSKNLGTVWQSKCQTVLIDAAGHLTAMADALHHPSLLTSIPTWRAIAALYLMPPTLASHLPTNKKEVQVFNCDNHDDGATVAAYTCEQCGHLCETCDTVLHRPQAFRSHLRTPCKTQQAVFDIRANALSYTSGYLCIVSDKTTTLHLNAQFSLVTELLCESCKQSVGFRSMMASLRQDGQKPGRLACCSDPKF